MPAARRLGRMSNSRRVGACGCMIRRRIGRGKWPPWKTQDGSVGGRSKGMYKSYAGGAVRGGAGVSERGGGAKGAGEGAPVVSQGSRGREYGRPEKAWTCFRTGPGDSG